MAAEIQRLTGLPWKEVDSLTWDPGWVEVPPEEQRRRIAEICAGEQWILDSAYAKWLDIALERVEVIIALDYPRWFSFGRLVKRSIVRAIDRKPICNGNVEEWRGMFSRKSILVWHFKSFKSKRARIERWSNDPTVARVIRLKSAQAANRFMSQLAEEAALRAVVAAAES